MFDFDRAINATRSYYHGKTHKEDAEIIALALFVQRTAERRSEWIDYTMSVLKGEPYLLFCGYLGENLEVKVTESGKCITTLYASFEAKQKGSTRYIHSYDADIIRQELSVILDPYVGEWMGLGYFNNLRVPAEKQLEYLAHCPGGIQLSMYKFGGPLGLKNPAIEIAVEKMFAEENMDYTQRFNQEYLGSLTREQLNKITDTRMQVSILGNKDKDKILSLILTPTINEAFNS